MASSDADVAMELEVVEEWDQAAEEWDEATEAWDEAAEDWDYEAAEEVADEMALEEETCHWCGSPAWFAGYPFCEGCDQANWRALLRAQQQQQQQHFDDDDATTAAGDPPEEFSDSDDWDPEYD
jgi:hypothetical protein